VVSATFENLPVEGVSEVIQAVKVIRIIPKRTSSRSCTRHHLTSGLLQLWSKFIFHQINVSDLGGYRREAIFDEESITYRRGSVRNLLILRRRNFHPDRLLDRLLPPGLKSRPDGVLLRYDNDPFEKALWPLLRYLNSMSWKPRVSTS
jgi:hypothetical protein